VHTHENAALRLCQKTKKRQRERSRKGFLPRTLAHPEKGRKRVEENEKTLFFEKKKDKKDKSVPTSSSFSRVVFIVFIVIVVDFLFFFSPRGLLLPRV
jgi:hypothetical protein